MLKYACLYFLFNLVFLFQSYSQQQKQLILKQYNVEDGLPSSEVYNITKDHEGFLWMSTDRGVARFDGQSFKTYTSENGLCDNTVFGCTVDDRNSILVNTFRGCISTIKGDLVTSRKENNFKKGITLSNKGYIAKVNRQEGSFHFGRTTNLFLHNDNHLYNSAQTFDIHALLDSNYKPDLGKYEKLFHFNSITNHEEIEISKYGNTIAILERSYRKVTIFKNNNLFNEMYLTNNPTGFIHLEDERTLWYGVHHNGAYKVDLLTGTFTNYMSGYSITDVFSDSSCTWFSTLNGGVFCSISEKIGEIDFSAYTSKKRIRALISTPHSVWFTTHNLLGFTIDSTQAINPIPCTSGRGLLLDRNQNVWVSHAKKKNIEHGSHLYDSRSKKVIDSNYMFFNDAFISQKNELIHRQSIDTTLSSYQDWTFIRKKFVGYFLISYELDSNTGLIGCPSGLYIWNKNKKQFNYLGEREPLLKSRINDIIKYKGRLILSSLGGGIYIMDSDKVINTISTENGLVSNLCNQSFVDSNAIWVATNKGISRIVFTSNQLDEYEISNFTKNDGLLTNEIHSIAILKDYVYAGSPKGLMFFPKNINKQPFFAPGIYWKKSNCNGSPITPNEFQRWPNDQNNIEFHFGGISPVYNNQLKYIYKLTKYGIPTDWDTTKLTSLKFNNLKHGQYQIEIYALLGDKVSKKTLSYSFVIEAAYWQTWWFKLTLSLLTVSLIIGLTIAYVKRQNRIRDIQILNQRNQLLAYENKSFQEEVKIKELEKSNISLKLEKNSRELTSYTLTSVQYSTLFRNLVKDINTIQLSAKIKNKNALESLKSQIRSYWFQEKQWSHFNELFKNVHRNFISNLKQKHSNLSANEIRICCLIKLGLLSNEIASIMNISVDSLNSAKYRIRRKVGLKSGAKLSNYLLNFEDTK